MRRSRSTRHNNNNNNEGSTHGAVILFLVLIGMVAVAALILGIIALIRADNANSSLASRERMFILPDNAVRISDDHFRIFHENSSMIGEIFVYRYNKTMSKNGGSSHQNGSIAKTKHNVKERNTDLYISGLHRQCYGPLIQGVRWHISGESFVFDPTNSVGLSVGFLTNAYLAAITTWESIANFNIWGNMVLGSLDPSTFGSYDGVNGAAFGQITIPGATGLSTFLKNPF